MKGDGSGRPPLDKDLEVRIPVGLVHVPGVTLGFVRVYVAIRNRVGFEPAATNFLLSWPSVLKIAGDAGIDRATVYRALAWLEANDFMVRIRKQNRSNDYFVIVHRARFMEIAARDGRAEAIRAFEEWRTEAADESRRGQARAAAERRARQESGSRRKSHPCDVVPVEISGQSQACDPRGGTDATSGVSAVRPITVDQENRGSGNRGVADAAPLLTENSKGSDDDRAEIGALIRATRLSLAKAPSPAPQERLVKGRR